MTPAIEQAGITKPKIGWHSLRRSYASLLLSTGASLRVSMELMRSTAEMTLSTYAQTVGDEKRELPWGFLLAPDFLRISLILWWS